MRAADLVDPLIGAAVGALTKSVVDWLRAARAAMREVEELRARVASLEAGS